MEASTIDESGHLLANSPTADIFGSKMASSLYGVLFAVGLCAPVYCVSLVNAPSGCPHPSSTESTPASLVYSLNTDFAFHLYRRLVLETPSQNVFFSPVSVSTSLAMLSLGAHSVTKTQILEGLGFNLTHTPESAIHQGFQHLVHSLTVPSKDLALKMGSALFVKKELQLQANFLGNVKRLVKINSHVKKKTQGKVVDIIQGLDLLTAMVLMDYKGEAVAFFVLPSKGKMRQLEQALSARTLRKWSHSLQKRWIEVFIPKFSISASYNLETILPKMGIQNAFDENADFSGITKRDSLQLSKATHKAVLDVSEEGTGAAAATATKFIVRSKDGPSYLTVSFNRTFLIMITNKATDSILFLGKVENPTKS
ncbi:hypothetical protein H8959_016911 [Pygathrix nigripes]